METRVSFCAHELFIETVSRHEFIRATEERIKGLLVERSFAISGAKFRSRSLRLPGLITPFARGKASERDRKRDRHDDNNVHTNERNIGLF